MEEDAFQALKTAITTAPVLKFPDESKQFVIHVDAGPYDIGGVLSQEGEDKKLYPVAFLSRKLDEVEHKRPQDEREMMALLLCLRAWKYYFVGRSKAKIYTDNAFVTRLRKCPDPHHRIHRYLQEYESWVDDIEHVAGEHNIADGLSRNESVPPKKTVRFDLDEQVNQAFEVHVLLDSEPSV